MKYIKLYEEIKINFDDIDEEEFDESYIHIKVGDRLKNGQFVDYWNSDYWTTIYEFNSINNEILRIEKSENVKNNPVNGFSFSKIPDGEIVFSLNNHWPWFRYNKNLKVEKN